MPRRPLSRFLHLERPRAAAEPAGPAPGGEPGADGRFDAVERAAPGGAAATPTGARLERFEPARRAEQPLELSAPAAGERPFTRCARCEMDHGRHAAVCAGCGAPLDTEEQLAFNETLWAARQAEAAREAAAGEALRAAQEQARAEESAARRALGETLAREVGARERRRLGVAGWGAGDDRPLGAVLLDALPARLRTGATIAAVALVLALAAGGLLARSPGAVALGIIAGIALFVPRGGPPRRWRG